MEAVRETGREEGKKEEDPLRSDHQRSRLPQDRPVRCVSKACLPACFRAVCRVAMTYDDSLVTNSYLLYLPVCNPACLPASHRDHTVPYAARKGCASVKRGRVGIGLFHPISVSGISRRAACLCYVCSLENTVESWSHVCSTHTHTLLRTHRIVHWHAMPCRVMQCTERRKGKIGELTI